jgi:O-antigen ligase
MPHTAVLPIEKALAFTLGLFLLLPLYRGGNVVIAIELAACWSLILLALCAAHLWQIRDARFGAASIALFAAFTLLLVHGLISLFTVSTDTWLAFAGREFYRPLIEANLPQLARRTQLALSLDPLATQRALLLIVACIGPALASLLLRVEYLKWVLLSIAALVIAEAVLGLLQIALLTPSMLGYQQAIGGDRAVGTFVNKNHFASLLAMLLPLLILRATGRFSFTSSEPPRSLSNVWWGVAAAVVVAALIASLSRAGVATAALVSAVMLALCALRERSLQSRVALAAIVVAALLLGSMAGFSRLLESVSSKAFATSAADRLLMSDATFAAAWQFFPWGTGLGSYAIAFQRFQTPQLVGFIEYAHNDYAQLVFEAGAVGVLVIALLALAAALAVRQMVRVYRHTRMLSPAFACFLGVVAFALHAWFDFPARIPANAVLATMLFAIAVNRDWHRVSQLGRHSKLGRRTRVTHSTIRPNS